MNSFIKTLKNMFIIILITIIFIFLTELGLRLYSFSKGVDDILLYGFNFNKEIKKLENNKNINKEHAKLSLNSKNSKEINSSEENNLKNNNEAISANKLINYNSYFDCKKSINDIQTSLINANEKQTIWGHDVKFDFVGWRNQNDIYCNKNKKIFIFGGSFVFGTGLSTKDSWIYLANEHLKKNNLTLINAGLGGSKMQQIIWDLEKRLKYLNINEIILISAYNNRSFQDFEKDKIYLTQKFLLERSWAYYLTFHYVNKILHSFNADNSITNQSKFKFNKIAFDKAIEKYLSLLKEFHQLCKKNNINLVLMTQPHYIASTYKKLSNLNDIKIFDEIDSKINKKRISFQELQYYEMYILNDLAMKYALKHDLKIIDGIKVFNNTNNDKNFIDQIHFSKKGSQIFSKYFTSEVLQRYINN